MLSLFEMISERRKEIEKQAFIAAGARLAAKGLGKMVKNPITTLGAGLTAAEVGTGFNTGTGIASASRNMAKQQASTITNNIQRQF